MGETIRKFKLFTVYDFDKEEAYLSSMAKKGYHLFKVTYPGFYHFEKGEPKEVSYRLDFRNRDTEVGELIQISNDYGWQYLFSFWGYMYFRKDGSNHHELFTDNQSKIDMLSRIFKGRLLPVLIIFFIVFIMDFPDYLPKNISQITMFQWFYIIMFVIYVIAISYLGIRLLKLRSKYK